MFTVSNIYLAFHYLLVHLNREYNLNIRFGNFFRPQSLKDGTTFEMNQNGGIEVSEDKPVYQVFNLQSAGDSFALVKVWLKG